MEVYHNGEWGTVCAVHGWDLYDADIVCRELGYGQAISYLSSPLYGEGTGIIWLDNVNCVGNEFTIGNCSHNGWGVENCYHFAGANCSVSSGMYVHMHTTLHIYHYCLHTTLYKYCFVASGLAKVSSHGQYGKTSEVENSRDYYLLH